MILLIVILFLAVFIFYGVWIAKVEVSKGKVTSGRNISRGNITDVQDLFFRTLFTLLGYVAKRDGPVNRTEVKRTEVYMEKMELDANRKREAIRLFKLGSVPEFDADPTIKEFHGLAKKSPNLAQILIVYLIGLARADGSLDVKETDAVQKIAFGLGYSSIMFEHLLQMISAQDSFSLRVKRQNHQAYNQTNKNDKNMESKKSQSKNNVTDEPKYSSSADTVDAESCTKKTEKFNTRDDQLGAAYEMLDISSDASDVELKKAYRSLVNQYHPDKLIGQGLPPYMVQSATECFQTIQAAYKYIKDARHT